MQYSKFQRFTSFFVLFFFLFSTTFQFPVGNSGVFADSAGFKNIVSILVDEEIYGSVSGGVSTYANNISKQLENTKVVILPTPSTASAYEIASLNESLYFEGLKSIDNTLHNGKLVGTVIVGNLSLPVAHENNDAQKTIVPYVDFEDKYFLYNHENGKFEKNESNINGLGVEIWHGVISPNLGSKEKNITAINEYFSKNDDYYNARGLFEDSKGVLNGNLGSDIPEDYEPYVFYFDQIRETKAINLESYSAYQAFQENKEDIIYKRYNQALADTIKERILGSQDESLEKLQSILGESVDLSGPELVNVPDIQTRHIINKSTKKFAEIFSKGSIGELRKDVHNAGRYNYPTNKVNVDFIPYLVTILDSVNDEIIKEANDDLEEKIDDLVKNGLSRNIAIPTKFVNTINYRDSIINNIAVRCDGDPVGTFNCTDSEDNSLDSSYGDHYTNIYFGTQASNVTLAEQCTIYRGSRYNTGTIVRANRSYNVNNIQGDIDRLNSVPGDDIKASECLAGIESGVGLNGYYGRNTGLYLDQSKGESGELILKPGFDENGALVPLFDIQGSKSINHTSILEPSYLDCLENNYYLTQINSFNDNGFRAGFIETTYQTPIHGAPINWTCETVNPKYNYTKTYDGLYASGNCSGLTCIDGRKTVSFKIIPSYMEHKAPNVSTISQQIQLGITPSLPVDKNRYIDFMGNDDSYQKVEYEYLYRGFTGSTVDDIKDELKQRLDDKSSELISIRDLSGSVSPHLVQSYTGSIDLYNFLDEKETKTLQIGSDEKEITYIDSLAFAIYWNNLNSISAKYKFVFEHYLHDQFVNIEDKNALPEEKYNFPKNKKQYEIAYLGAHGDSENMYVQMNPESKGDNPYADIIQKNASLQSQLLGQNIGGANGATVDNSGNDEAMFKCAPPEGVPIFEWIPAIVCWLDDMLPPTITVSDSTCGPTLPLLSNEDRVYLEQCNGDVDKNGVNDCLENKLSAGGVALYSQTNRIYYNKPGNVKAKLFDEGDNTLTFDNNTKVNFDIVKIEVPEDSSKEFIGSNKQVVYTIGDDKENISKYINFAPQSLTVQGGVAEVKFTSKGFDANYYFQASVNVKDNNGGDAVFKESEIIKVEVRGDRLFATAYVIEENIENGNIEAKLGNDEVIVSESSQLFLIDKNNTTVEDVKKLIYSSNNNLNKVAVSLNNISKAGNTLSLAYPLSVNLLDDYGNNIIDEFVVNESQLSRYFQIPGITKAGSYTLEITDANGYISKKQLDFVSEEASKLEIKLGASVLETNGATTSNVVTILDRFDNPVIGKNNTLDIDINGNSVVFEHNNNKNSSSQVVEGYKIFRLKSLDKLGNNTLNISLKDYFGNELINKSQQIKVVENISVKILENSQLKVGGDTYTLKAQVVSDSGQVYNDFNSRVYFSINNVYGYTTQPYFDVVNGVAEIKLQTTTLAGSEIPVELQVEGLGSIYNDEIIINHDEPAYLQLGMDQYGVEAVEGSIANVEVYLKDQYGNITFNQNSGSVGVEILPEYEKYISQNGSPTIRKGVANVKIGGTDLPGMAYFKVSYNGFDAVGKLNSYYYWNNSAIEDTSYNALYTTLLGAPYGDVTKQNYLAGSLLFNDNRSLAVTSLLNSPYTHNDVVMIDSFGGIKSVANSSDLSTDINFTVNVENNKLGVSVKNSALGNYIGRIQPVLGGNTQLQVCKNKNGDINSCFAGKELEETTVFVSAAHHDYESLSNNSEIYLQNNYGKKVFGIDSDGNIIRDGKISFELENNKEDYLQIGIYNSGQKIGTMLYAFVGAEVKSTRNSDLFGQTSSAVSNKILLLLAGGSYAARDVYDNGQDNKVIYFNSPFDVDNTLNDFSKGNMSAYENFAEKKGLGWSEGNKSLLQFSSGESVGESVKMYQSFGVINLGDPVVSLKKIQRDLPKKSGTLRNFDGTIGKNISNKSTVNSYAIFDYNNDNKDDLILTHGNKYVELLENVDHEKDFISKGNLAQVYDLGSTDTVKAGDFTGDGYDDIVFVNNQGKLFLLNNVKKNFTRYDISQYSTNKVIRVEVGDMDKDDIMDIVILDEMGFVKVLYGLGISNKPEFFVEVAGNAGRPSLNGSPRTDKGAFYYSGLVTLGEAGDNSKLLSESEAFEKAIQDNVDNLGEYEGNGVNPQILDQLLFVKIPYKPGGVTVVEDTTSTQSGTAQNLIDSINIPTSPETENGINNSVSGLTDLLNNNQNVFTYPNVNPEIAESDFIKSEYAEVLDIKIEKTYQGDLIAGGKINFSLTIKNESDEMLGSAAYVEDIPALFTLDESTVSISDENAIIRYDIPGYNFLIDNFSLAPGQSITLGAKLTTAPIKYGHILLGNFQEPLSKEDGFLDIVYSASHQNCGETKTLFVSCATDKNGNKKNDCKEPDVVKPGFNQTTNTPKCNEDNIELPEDVAKNVTDNDGNGIPDYIDELSSTTPEDQANYANDIRNQISLDSDGDGIPDSEDLTHSSNDFLSNLEEIEDNVDHILAGVDNLIQGFSCGFGGGGCIATPLNWAPLAPGGDPTLFGVPIGDGLSVGEGIPVFSALTWTPPAPPVPPLPTVWPISPLSVGGSGMGAGGYLGIDNPSNFFRLFATPTLTGGFGVAACFGGPARVAGYANMPGLHPLLPGGNCIVTAMPLSSCSNDGSDGDPGSVGFSQVGGGGAGGGGKGGPGFGIFNANCTGDKSQKKDVDLDLVQEYLDYKTTGKKSSSFEERFKESFTKISDPNGSNFGPQLNDPLISFNGESLDDELTVNIDFGEVKAGNFADVIQVQNRRISAFPDFLMGWVTRQIEEIVNKLTDFPTVFIILPDFSGVLDFGDPDEAEDTNDFITADENLTELVGSGNINSVNSGIKEAYTFLSNIPLVKFEQETLAVEIPWVDGNEIKATEKKWSATLDQWSNEIQRAKEAWSFGAACNHSDPKKQKECEEANAASEKIILQTDALIGSMEQNLEVIKTYKDFPKRLNKLVKKKEDYLEQILCNVESISEILGGWIGRNGERFKAWVELYILIKAILKSWQLLIDVFVDYEAECYECKNERGDLMTFIWKIISAVIPQIPVIQFPKWPDIIIDLHNIRAGLTISLPEFTFGTRPILLPNLPNLYLPDVPTVSINLPEIPVLPTIDIPELPDLPMLPTVELPNLPPPPTLPKMFASLEGILEILKAITKAMCILKTSPFVPEWRAGDQIAFLTERQGYLPTDFIDLSMPQFSFPFVDAIKVTTFVNLEFETDFVTELARQITMPLTTFSNDFTQILNLGVDDLDFSQLPSHIDINIGGDGAESEISYNKQDLATGFALYLSKGIGDLVSYLDNNKNVTVSNSEFKILVSQALASDVFVSHPKYSSFRNVWDQVFEYDFEQENKFISDLQKNNFDKFETLKDILHTEILKNKELEKNIDKYIQPSFVRKVDAQVTSDVNAYNTQLEKYNSKFIESARDLVQPGGDTMVNELEERGEALKAKVGSISNNHIFASSNGGGSAMNQCQEQAVSPYRYQYKGIYVVETVGGEDYSYLLFDYLEDLDGKEKINYLDTDNDGDQDVIYMMNGQIFIKENLINSNLTPSNDVVTISSGDNPFYNGDIFYNAVNNFREGIIDNNVINAEFSSSTNTDIDNYRMTFSRLVDQTTQRKSIIDGFTDGDDITFIKENEVFSFGKNLAFIQNIGKFKDLVLTTKQLINIKDDLRDGNIVDISQGTKLYAGNQAFRLSYMIDGSTDTQVIVVNKNQHIELKSSIKVIGISGDAYIEGRYDVTLRSEEIRSYKGLPLSLGSVIEYVGNIDSIDPMTYVEVNYYDGSEALLNFNFIEKYWLYDLGNKQDKLAISVNMDNDYLYAYIQGFSKNIFSTESNQILLSPQKEADNIAPELYLPGIKIPVYQTHTINLGDMIYEDGGIKGIKEIIIDMDLESDSNEDGNNTNDQDVENDKIQHTSTELNVTFGPYDYLEKREIGITLIDENNNTSYSQIPFEIYSPTPEIETINELGLLGVIDEELDDEPVSLYRYRGGVISKLKNDDGTNKTWTDGGDYQFKVDEDSSGLTLEYGENIVAEISETTGKIDLKDFSSRIKVYPSNSVNNNSYYPKLEVQKSGNSIYYQYLQLSEGKTISLVDNFDEVISSGLYIDITNSNNYGYYQIPETVTYNPGAFVIYRLSDENKQPLFIIYPDGKIETLNDYYTLEYNYENEYIVLNLIDKHYNIEIAQLLFSIDGGYIMK